MRILLIDDHALFRIGLRELLERRGLEVVDAVGDCEAGIALVEEKQPDVVLLDMRMPQMSGLDVLQVLRDKGQQMPIVILTTSRVETDVIASLQCGAQGYLLKDMEPDDLIRSLNDIVAGQTVVANELTMVLAKAVRGDEPKKSESAMDQLTPREQEILCLLAEGQSNKVIARNLGISDGTVKLHVKAILRKLSVHSRVEAAVIAVEQKFCRKSES
ncbi:response regulator [Thiolapillus sp.]|uniref:Response regulator n=1 Tax=Thiolapillus brandeum TaxID=1076588 RepID=A0A831RW36_9GAMM|nr:response regulator [Thiolapillus sp.]HEC07087.1 response regulator [Thiolapillus brandeum]